MPENLRRVAVIGNSHIGALRNGWRASAGDFPGISLTFFGAIGRSLRELALEGRALVPMSGAVRDTMRMTSRGLERIDLDAYDEVVVVAMEFSLRRLLRLHQTHRHPGLAGGANAPHLVSRAAFRMALSDALDGTVALQLVRRIRSVDPDKPLRLVPQPRRRRGGAACEPGTVGMDVRTEDAPILCALFDEVSAEVCARAGAAFCPQPPETIEQWIWTAPEYGDDAANVSGAPTAAGDLEHMGERYGRAVLRSLFSSAGT